MKLKDYETIFVVVGLIGALLITTPALYGAIHISGGEQFSELYLLGPNQTAENYPSNIAVGQNYSVYLSVGNQLGISAYYVLYVKLGNQTDQMPNYIVGTSSSLQPLYEYRFSIQNSLSWESLLTFSVSNASISGNNSQIYTLQLNGFAFNVDKPAMRDSNSTTFNYRLFFELWIYNEQNGSVEFNNRYLNLPLNLTQTT